MALTSMELQLLENLQRKQIAELNRAPISTPTMPAAAAPFDLNILNNLIDQRVAERIQAAPSLPPLQPAQPLQSPKAPPADPATQAGLSLRSESAIMLQRLQPLLMAALTLQQKGRLAELAFAVRTQSNSTEQAYRIGFDALCDFLTTPTGKEWIQVGTNAFFQALEPQAQVPQSVNVNTQ